MLAPKELFAAENKIAFIFVGASWCPVCHQAAPMLALFSRRTGVPVLVASQDGRPIAPFERFVPSAEHPIAMSVKLLPTTLVYSNKTENLIASIEGYRNSRSYFNQLKAAFDQGNLL
jgi:thiol-disulfide isomerase/thioredoxin